MRFFKKTIFWVIMLAVLGGSFFIFDKEVEEKKVVEELKKRLFAFEPADVAEFTIEAEGRKIVIGRMGEDVWSLAEPLIAKADSKNIKKFLDSLVLAKWDGVLFEDPPPEKLEELGLKDPYLTVILKTNRETTHTIFFGDYGPTHNVSFVTIDGDSRIFRIHSDRRAEADKEVYDLRDKTVLPFDTTKVKSFDIIWDNGEHIEVLHPEGGRWDADGLPEGKTDFLKVMEMLITLNKTEIKAFVEETPKTLKPFGLENPRVLIYFKDEKGTRHSILLGGKDKEQRGVFSKSGGRKNVFLLEEDVLEAIPRSVADLEETLDEEPSE